MIADPRNGCQYIFTRTKMSILSFWMALCISPMTASYRTSRPVQQLPSVRAFLMPGAYTPLRMLIIFSPGRIEGLFREVAAGDGDDISSAVNTDDAGNTANACAMGTMIVVICAVARLAQLGLSRNLQRRTQAWRRR